MMGRCNKMVHITKTEEYIFITRVISICIFAIIFLAMPIFCDGLKKGAHYIKNDTTNASFYINEKGQV